MAMNTVILNFPGQISNVWRHFWLTVGGGGKCLPLESSGRGPGMLLNIPQCTGKLLQQGIFQSTVLNWGNHRLQARW
jgi:hypothetical protein